MSGADVLPLPEQILALIEKHGGWRGTLEYIGNLEAGNIAYAQQVAHLIGRAGNAEAALALATGAQS